MGRKLRIQYKNAWYHVMNRGAGKKYIFNLDQNKSEFLSLISKVHLKYEMQVHAYCIMGNHYHLLVRTPKANIADSIKYIQGLYTKIHNAKIDSDGPIFRSRYKSVLLETTNSVLQVCRYIHKNPVEAKMPERFHYNWSSYKYYISPSDDKPKWLYDDFVLSSINNNCGIDGFVDFHKDLNSKELISFYNQTKNDDFSVMNDITLQRAANEVMKIRLQSEYTCECLNKWINMELINHDIEINKCKRLNLIIFVIVAKEIYGYSIDDIQKFKKYKSPSTIYRVYKEFICLFDDNDIIDYLNRIDDVDYIINSVLMKIIKPNAKVDAKVVSG